MGIQRTIYGPGSATSVPLPTGSPAIGKVPTVTATSPLALDWELPSGGGGSTLTPTATKTANYTLAVGDLVPFDISSASLNGTLPTTPVDKAQVFAYIKTFGTGHTLTLTAGGSDVIESASGTAATVTRSAGAGESVWLQYDHANGLWRQLPDRIPLSVLDARFTPVNNTGSGAAAAMGFTLDPATFLSVVDPIWKIGYNPDRPVTSEPQWYMGIEGNYKIASGAEGWDSSGTHLLNEWYVNYASPDNSTVVNFRPIYVGVKRDGNSSHAAHIFFDVGTEGSPNSQLVVQAGASPIVTMTSTGLYLPSNSDLKIGTQQVLTNPTTKASSFSFTPTGQFASTPVANTQYRARVIIRDSGTITGISIMNDSAVAGNVIVSLYDSTGAQLKVSNSTAVAGTFTPQFVPFTSTFINPPDGVYYVTSIFSSASTHLDLVNSLSGGAGTAAIGSFTTPGSFTPPAINSGAQVPIMSTY